jgi:IMP cyclohydrolase
MDNPLAPLRRMAYPGRLILLGKDASGRSVIVLYAVTGRSPSSQARRLVRDGRAVWTRPTDPEVLKTGRPDLLVYPAIMIGRGIAVSNGRQTADIDPDGDGGPVETLERGLKDWSYEPDAPIHTPRISGCVLPSGRAALAVLRRAEGGGILRSFFEIPLAAGRGRLVATYSGENRDPVPSFEGEPLDLRLAGATARDTAEAAYAALGPSEEGGRDFRVAVACLFADAADLSQFELHIINREEGKRS